MNARRALVLLLGVLLMPLPTSNLTIHCDASDTDNLFTTWDSSGGVHSGVPANGDLVRVWDDEDDSVVGDVAMVFEVSILFNCPVYRSSGTLMLHPCLDFQDDDGAFDQMISHPQGAGLARPAEDFWGVGAKTVLIAFYPETITADNASVPDNHGLIATGEDFGLTLRDDSGTKRLYAFNNAQVGGLATCNVAGVDAGRSWVAAATHDGTTLTLKVVEDDGTLHTATVASTDNQDLDIALSIGRAGDAFFDGRIGEFATYNVALTGDDLLDALNYFSEKWLGVSVDGGDPGRPGADTVGSGGIVEMCFHAGSSFRTGIQFRDGGLAAQRFWWLGDVGTLDATDAMHEDPQVGAFGTYETVPTKVRGLIPEYGLATWFDGAVQRVTTLTGLTGTTGGFFSLVALIRPDAAGLGAAQCIYQTGGVGSAYLGLNASDQVVFGVNGGTLVASTLAVEADREYFIVGAYDGSEGSVFVVECVADAEVDQGGPTAMTFTAPHDIGTIGSNENTAYFTGAIQHVAELSGDPEGVLDLADVENLRVTTYWTDVTADVEGVLTSDIGIHDDSPLSRVARSGQLLLTMDNSHLNSAGLEGYYAPDHANCRNGFHRGIPIRFSLFDQASPTGRRVQFIGTIKTIRPTAGIYLERRTGIVATDWMDEAARTTLRGIAVLTDVTADQVVGAIVNSMRNRPHAIEFATGSDTYPVALHNATDEGTRALAELGKVALSELGLVFVRGDGTLVFEARSTRSTLADVDYTLTDFLTVEQDDATDQAKNLIKVTAHPSRVGDDPAQVLHSTNALASPADPAIRLDNGVDFELFVPFKDLVDEPNRRIGAVSIIPPVAGVDYTINTAEDGSGLDVTTNPLITLDFTLGGNGVYLRVDNQYGNRVWLVMLQIRGRAVFDYEPVTAIAKNRNDIDATGEQELAIDMPYQSDVGIAQGAADFLLNALRERNTRIRAVRLWGDYNDLHRDALIYGGISTRIHASELMSGVSGEFFVNAKRIEWRPSGDTGKIDIDVTFHLADAAATGMGQFWILGESILEETTVLGYL